ncbi:Hsp70 family protein [Kribbella sp. NPDC006257]|uniref:Hsp70 family protein n=1 Tax=Kribbella sp. NPDC006257 TaxID=3156738 RepID=UPI0033BF83E3
MGYRLGVDLGTTFTAAAIRNGGPPSMLGLGNRALQIPSVLYLQENGKFLVGEAAERRAVTDPSRAVREFKRRIGDPIPLLVAGTPYSAQVLSARLLSSVVATATERRGEPPDEIVLTHPANWGAYKRELVDQVISLADVGPTVTCPEPQAAAIQYAAQARLAAGDRVVVYDLGGGTFDVCVLEKTLSGFVLLGNPEGIEQLGGVDFDEAVFQHVADALGPALEQLDLDSEDGKATLTRLRRDCVDAKEALSADVDVVIPVNLPGRTRSVRLTRAELENLITAPVEQTVEATARALRTAGTTTTQLTAIVLVGGSSRIPLVSHLLQSRFSTPTALNTHPKHDVALGAVQFTSPPPQAAAPRITSTSTAASPPEVNAPGLADPAPSPPPLAGTNAGPGRLPKPPRKRRLYRRIAQVLAGVLATATIAFLVHPWVFTPAVTIFHLVIGGLPDKSSSDQAGGASSGSLSNPGLPAAGVPLSDTQLVVPLQNSDGQALYLVDTSNPGNTMKVTQLAVDAVGKDSGPVVSPDRKAMIFTRSIPSTKPALWVSGTDGRGARPLFAKLPSQCADGIDRPAWNPKDPTQLVLACRGAKTIGLYLADTDGKILRTLFSAPEGSASVSDPAISPDATQVAFQAQRTPANGVGGIYTVPLDGSRRLHQLTSGADADPTWSPTKPGRIAFRHTLSAKSWAIYLTDVGGTSPLCRGKMTANPLGGMLCHFTDGSSLDQDPAWSPDGRQLAFRRGPLSSARVYTTAVYEDKEWRPLWPAGAGNQLAPAWSTR